MADLKVPAVTIELEMRVHEYLPFAHRAFGDDGLYGEPVNDPSLIYVASDEGLLMSFSYTALIDKFLDCNRATRFPIVGTEVRNEVVALRNYLLRQAEKLNRSLPAGDPSRIVVGEIKE